MTKFNKPDEPRAPMQNHFLKIVSRASFKTQSHEEDLRPKSLISCLIFQVSSDYLLLEYLQDHISTLTLRNLIQAPSLTCLSTPCNTTFPKLIDTNSDLQQADNRFFTRLLASSPFHRHYHSNSPRSDMTGSSNYHKRGVRSYLLRLRE